MKQEIFFDICCILTAVFLFIAVFGPDVVEGIKIIFHEGVPSIWNGSFFEEVITPTNTCPDELNTSNFTERIWDKYCIDPQTDADYNGSNINERSTKK